MPEFDVFLSHNSLDKPWVSHLKEDLQRYELRVWLDRDEIRPGDLFARALEQGLASSGAMALVVSLEAMASGWVEREYYRALSLATDKKIRLQLIPVILREAELPGFLQDLNWVDFREENRYAESVAKLVWGITGQKPAQVLPLTAPVIEPLAALPEEGVPEVGPLPKGSRLPFAPNPLFVGREVELQELARLLKVGETAAIGQIAAATGLGGIGKTQLAVEFAHRYGRYFSGGVFWLSFAAEAAVATEVAACGGRAYLNLGPDFERLDLLLQVQMVQAAWQEATPRLLVFDNCEEEALLDEWRPKRGGCRVVVTSRRGEWDVALGVQTLQLKVLPRQKSLELLRKFRPDLGESDPDLDALAGELGDLPLALHLAGSFLKAYKREVTPQAYLAELRGEVVLEHESLVGVDVQVSPTNHELHVGRTFALSYERLKADDPIDALALALLGRAAYFAPGEPISQGLLLKTVELPEKQGNRQGSRALRRLMGLGLLEEAEEGTMMLHRLVGYFVRGSALNSGGGGEAAQAAVEVAVLEEVDQHLDQAGYLTQLGLSLLHVRAVADEAQVRDDERAADLCIRLGYYLNQVGDYGAARPYYERALAIREAVLGANHPDTAQGLNNLAFLLQAQGDYGAARPYYERALAIKEEVLGANHPDTAQGLNNLAFLLEAQGDYGGAARPYFERALAIKEEVLGANHPSTATSLNNLALLLKDQGDYAAAKPYYERALAIREAVLGANHPDTATSLNNLASLLHDQGDYAAAKPYYERALAICEVMPGANHPSTATSLNNLALLLKDQGDYAAAKPYCERALAICEEVLGPEHPNTATSLNNLASLLQAQGDYGAARPYYERALAICEKVLGAKHPNTAGSLNNLAFLLQAQGDYAAAKPYCERALAICEEVLGPEHPTTALSLNNLALLLQAQGDYGAARPYYERALAICEQVLGPEHPNTRLVRGNLTGLPSAGWALMRC